jgi:hypothetical protein
LLDDGLAGLGLDSLMEPAGSNGGLQQQEPPGLQLSAGKAARAGDSQPGAAGLQCAVDMRHSVLPASSPPSSQCCSQRAGS